MKQSTQISKLKNKQQIIKIAHRLLKPLELSRIIKDYQNTQNRIILLDHDGTLIKSRTSKKIQHSLSEPTRDLLHSLEIMSADKKNMVYIITGKSKESLGTWYNGIKNLGIVCEYGCQYKNEECRNRNWVNLFEFDKLWQQSVIDLFQKYEYLSEGSYIERKNQSVVWRYPNIDLKFGRRQGDQLIKELKKKFQKSREINIARGENYIEVKPYGMNKGTVAEILIKKAYLEKGKIDFILAIGNALSDEEMFASINKNRQYHNPYLVSKSSQYLCTVSPKPSNASFYLENVNEVQSLICSLANPK